MREKEFCNTYEKHMPLSRAKTLIIRLQAGGRDLFGECLSSFEMLISAQCRVAGRHGHSLLTSYLGTQQNESSHFNTF